VNAAFLGYDANVYTYNTYGQGAQTQGYLGINAGANLGAWHFRHNGSYSWSTQGSAQYQSLNTYLQRDIPRLSAQLTIGESYTS
ncbi:fimbria/pilus outer membrane usher protein, partial [Brevibacillus sp. SIMBA_076]